MIFVKIWGRSSEDPALIPVADVWTLAFEEKERKHLQRIICEMRDAGELPGWQKYKAPSLQRVLVGTRKSASAERAREAAPRTGTGSLGLDQKAASSQQKTEQWNSHPSWNY